MQLHISWANRIGKLIYSKERPTRESSRPSLRLGVKAPRVFVGGLVYTAPMRAQPARRLIRRPLGNYMTTQLPEQWWRRKDIALLFANHLMPGFLQLIVRFINNKNQVERLSCTGVIMNIVDNYVWISAGHVIDAINYYAQNNRIIDANWIDGVNIPDAPVLLSSKKTFTMVSFEKQNHDFGALIIPILDAAHLRLNPNIKPFTISTHNEYSKIEPEGYILVGYPYIKVKITSKPYNNKQEKVHIETELISLPVKNIQPPALSTPDQHWDDKSAFYGEILPYYGETDVYFDDYRGMSGGAVLSLRKTETNVQVFIEGIFASFQKDNKWIRAEPINLVILMLEEWIKNLNQ
jgi:hypothetical protein